MAHYPMTRPHLIQEKQKKMEIPRQGFTNLSKITHKTQWKNHDNYSGPAE